MAEYQHGVYLQEIETELQTVIESESNLICAIGTSPAATSVNVPEICYSLTEFTNKFGFDYDFDRYTLCEVAHCQFTLYNVSPLVCINVFDRLKHKTKKTKDIIISGNSIELGETINVEDVKITTGSVEDESFLTLEKDEDYSVTSAGIIENLATSKIVEGKISVEYSVPDVSKVTTTDILESIEKLEEVYPRFNLVPSILIAPKYSQNADVIAGLKAKTRNLNGHFNCIAIVDIPTSSTPDYSDATSVKTSLNISDANIVACWGITKLNNRRYYLSTQLASLMHYTDSQNGENPSLSPSNQRLQMDSMVKSDGTEVYLSVDQAKNLNGEGIVTALHFQGWKAFGNRTSIYPTSGDPKDNMISVRRVFNWVGNTLITTFWSRLDSRLSRRFIDSVLNSAQMWFDGLIATGVLLGGSVSFMEEDNPLTSLQDGVVKFRVMLTPPSPARVIIFTSQYDPSALQTLFETE